MPSELPLDLITDLENLPILATAPNIHSYNQAPIEDSLVIRESRGNQRRQILDTETIQSEPLHEIHKLIQNRASVSQNFVDKLVALHMGHITMAVEDLTDYFFHLDQVFHDFAHHSQDYLTLSKNDRMALLIANAPLYYHLYLTR